MNDSKSPPQIIEIVKETPDLYPFRQRQKMSALPLDYEKMRKQIKAKYPKILAYLGEEHVMQPFQQRVIDEKNNLDAKIVALKLFIQTELYDTLPEDERNRLNMQIVYMRQYSGVLGDRINHFVDTGTV